MHYSTTQGKMVGTGSGLIPYVIKGFFTLLDVHKQMEDLKENPPWPLP